MRRRTFLAQCAALAAPRIAIAGRPSRPQDQDVAAVVSSAVDYLIGRQGEDGSWASDVYGAFKDGRALTPLVTLALRRGAPASSRDGVAGAMAWIRPRMASLADVFPIHNASWLLQSLASAEGGAPLRAMMTDRLRALQLNAAGGWDREHPYFGGWSYAPRAPRGGAEIAPFQQPNLSASVLAVAGLSASGVDPGEPVMRDALSFLRRCQNFDTERGRPSRFDDGGFFQLHDDPTRNKAGVAGTDGEGRIRQRSYTSATADGLRGLTLCGLGAGDAEVEAAVRWLRENIDLQDVPDLQYYAAYSVGCAGAMLPDSAAARPWRDQIASLLIEHQRADGSWRNPAGEMRENDPLVATSLAVLSLA